ncbi:MAG: hypothetical protein QM539_04390, partial [Alphaproteobacteria bacterium]|nr:hypothetical protein [Alphaproteobacteria bacterium]
KFQAFNSEDAIKNEEYVEKFVIYDHHNIGYQHIQKKYNPKDLDFINKSAFFIFDKNSIDYILLSFPDQNLNNKKLLIYEAFEAGLKKIIIADERIIEKYNFQDNNTKKIKDEYSFKVNSVGKEPTIGDLCNNGNVFLCSEFNNQLIKDNIKVDNLKIKQDLKITLNLHSNRPTNFLDDVNKNIQSCDCLIIHRTFLINYLNSNNTDLTNLKINKLMNKFKRIIVVSGGGYPHNIELDYKLNFIPLTNLNKCFKNYPSKISLNKLI